ncbi:unnamed protein product [Gadus morhua 'NCC']
MLLLSRAAWSSLCLAVVAMAAELTQDQVSWTRREGENVTFRCTNTDQCANYILWYQKKETKTFTVILRIQKSNGNIYKGYNHPQKDDFSSVLKENSCPGVLEEERGGRGGGKDGEQLELRAPTYAASILVIDQGETLTDQYNCSVEHESGRQEVEVPAESLQVLSRARLASVLYTVMVVKSVLCCCGLALLLLHTNKTSRTPRTSTTTALD